MQLLAEHCHFTSDDDVLKQSVLLQCHERNAEHMSETPESPFQILGPVVTFC